MGLPPVWQESQLFEPLETCQLCTGRTCIRGCAPPPQVWAAVPLQPPGAPGTGIWLSGSDEIPAIVSSSARRADRGGDLVGSEHPPASPQGPRAGARVDLGAPLREDYFRGLGCCASARRPWETSALGLSRGSWFTSGFLGASPQRLEGGGQTESLPWRVRAPGTAQTPVGRRPGSGDVRRAPGGIRSWTQA